MKAEESQRVGERVFYWEAYDAAVKTSLSCCAVKTAQGLVYIDPIPLAADAWAELMDEVPAAAVVLTSGNHLRAGREFAGKLGVPLRAHAAALAELSMTGEADALAEGDVLGGELR